MREASKESEEGKDGWTGNTRNTKSEKEADLHFSDSILDDFCSLGLVHANLPIKLQKRLTVMVNIHTDHIQSIRDRELRRGGGGLGTFK